MEGTDRSAESLIGRPVGNLVATALFLWAAVGAYTTFARGEVPLLEWNTDRNLVLGIVWLFWVFPAAAVVARTFRNLALEVAAGVGGIGLLLFGLIQTLLTTYGFALIPLAWFRVQLPLPFEQWQGSIGVGLLVLVGVVGVLLPLNMLLVRSLRKAIARGASL